MDRVVPNGPKVVLATDSCLSSGLSKELLLSWGGDPRCCVVFVDQADTGSLAADLKAKYSSPPVIATITKPIRVELAGAELESHRAEQERRRRIKEESFHRKRRQQELTKVCAYPTSFFAVLMLSCIDRHVIIHYSMLLLYNCPSDI